MKNFKKLLAVTAIVAVLGTAGAVYAADIQTPAQIVAAITGKSAETVTAERADGKTYGTIANESNKLDEFKAKMLEQKKAILDQRVKDGTLTQAEADKIYNEIKENQALCNGTGLGRGTCGGLGAGANSQGLCGRGAGFGRGMMNR